MAWCERLPLGKHGQKHKGPKTYKNYVRQSSREKCEHRCGDVDVPFPFGLNTSCANSTDFLLNCTNIEGGDIQLRWGNLTIRSISVGDSTMVASLPEAYKCYDQNGTLVNQSSSLAINLSSNPRYRFSETQNKLTVVGCNTLAVVADGEGTFRSGCMSYCSGNVDFANKTTCSGQGCCQASIPVGLKTLNINISSIGGNVSAWQRGRCARAFVVANRSFNISNLTLPGFQDVGNNPVLVLDWMVEPNVTCPNDGSNWSSPCGKNADCKNFTDGSGYRCVCKSGYNGNPYNPNEGCIDINECQDPKKYRCDGKCKNKPGNYTCQCRFRKKGNAMGSCKFAPLGIAVSRMTWGTGICASQYTILNGANFPHKKWITCLNHQSGNIYSLSTMAVSFFGITVTASFSVTMRWRIRKINFRRNGGALMRHRKVSIFTESKLAKATNNYDERAKLHNDGFGSVHKGTLEEHRGTVVVVKKPKDLDESQLNKDFQRDLEILMNISGKNVVQLKGICLETKIPSLVYEYVPNGTLFEHIHPAESTIYKSSTILTSWKSRFKIAAEAALALDYMHSNIQPPIFHGNIKSANILLDQKYSTKVSDFGTSVFISPEHRHIIANQKKDSLGYIDPEYLITGMLTTQSDVYSFGVILVELLTRKKLYVTESGKSINTIHRFISSVKGEKLSHVIDFAGASEDEMEGVRSVAEIAVRCLDQSGVNRPGMSEVAQQLADIATSSTVEGENEDPEGAGVEEEVSSFVEQAQDVTSSCLSCLGEGTACSCI
ncbi:hypothetical protein BT93_F0041 [Corymbia citriodora subsp. variegata]|nr:hypothetical protein BT93_F0041 [Corymbia citriodora subsp. variegata]